MLKYFARLLHFDVNIFKTEKVPFPFIKEILWTQKD